MLKELLWPMFYLAVVCSAAAAALAVTDKVTRPEIERNHAEKRRRLTASVLPGTKKTVPVLEAKTPEKKTGKEEENACEKCLDKNGRLLGYVVTVAPRGYGGPVKLIVGFKTDQSLSGVAILESKETPGLGKKAEDEEWLAQFRGLRAAQLPESKQALKKAGSKVEAITASTITSWAVTRGVREAAEKLEATLKKAGATPMEKTDNEQR